MGGGGDSDFDGLGLVSGDGNGGGGSYGDGGSISGTEPKEIWRIKPPPLHRTEWGSGNIDDSSSLSRDESSHEPSSRSSGDDAQSVEHVRRIQYRDPRPLGGLFFLDDGHLSNDTAKAPEILKADANQSSMEHEQSLMRSGDYQGHQQQRHGKGWFGLEEDVRSQKREHQLAEEDLKGKEETLFLVSKREAVENDDEAGRGDATRSPPSATYDISGKDVGGLTDHLPTGGPELEYVPTDTDSNSAVTLTGGESDSGGCADNIIAHHPLHPPSVIADKSGPFRRRDGNKSEGKVAHGTETRLRHRISVNSHAPSSSEGRDHGTNARSAVMGGLEIRNDGGDHVSWGGTLLGSYQRRLGGTDNGSSATSYYSPMDFPSGTAVEAHEDALRGDIPLHLNLQEGTGKSKWGRGATESLDGFDDREAAGDVAIGVYLSYLDVPGKRDAGKKENSREDDKERFDGDRGGPGFDVYVDDEDPLGNPNESSPQPWDDRAYIDSLGDFNANNAKKWWEERESVLSYEEHGQLSPKLHKPLKVFATGAASRLNPGSSLSDSSTPASSQGVGDLNPLPHNSVEVNISSLSSSSILVTQSLSSFTIVSASDNVKKSCNKTGDERKSEQSSGKSLCHFTLAIPRISSISSLGSCNSEDNPILQTNNHHRRSNKKKLQHHQPK